LATDLRMPKLGLSDKQYIELASSLNQVVHIGWPVNFNLRLASFEPSLEGVVNLMKLCFDSESSFYFVSSISAVYNWNQPTAVPEVVVGDPDIAQNVGYAQSKWVAENICKQTSDVTGLPVAIMRVGQLVGDSVNGIWNESEAVSLMIKAGDHLGIMPILEESPSWLPVDQAASVIVELLKSSSEQDSHQISSPCWHVLQSHRIPWPSVLDYLEKSGLYFCRVSISKWLQGLRDSEQDLTVNPSIKLLSFWESKYGQGITAGPKELVYEIEQTKRRTPTVSSLEAPGLAQVEKWIQHWKKTGFLKDRSFEK